MTKTGAGGLGGMKHSPPPKQAKVGRERKSVIVYFDPEMLRRVDKSCTSKLIKTSRQRWMMEAIVEKLDRENRDERALFLNNLNNELQSAMTGVVVRSVSRLSATFNKPGGRDQEEVYVNLEGAAPTVHYSGDGGRYCEIFEPEFSEGRLIQVPTQGKEIHTPQSLASKISEWLSRE